MDSSIDLPSETKKTQPKHDEMVMMSIVELCKEPKNRKGMTTVLISNCIKKSFDLDENKCYKKTKAAIDHLTRDGELVKVGDGDGVNQIRYKLSDSAKKRIKKTGQLLKSKSPKKKASKKTPAKKAKATTPKKPIVKKSTPKKTGEKTPKKTPTKKSTTTPKQAVNAKA